MNNVQKTNVSKHGKYGRVFKLTLTLCIHHIQLHQYESSRHY